VRPAQYIACCLHAVYIAYCPGRPAKVLRCPGVSRAPAPLTFGSGGVWSGASGSKQHVILVGARGQVALLGGKWLWGQGASSTTGGK
jgi:hypothetical protein